MPQDHSEIRLGFKPQAFFFAFIFFALLEIFHRAFTYTPNGVTPKTRANA
jgi:hypothetical protein